jgi:hypothetical protein
MEADPAAGCYRLLEDGFTSAKERYFHLRRELAMSGIKDIEWRENYLF